MAGIEFVMTVNNKDLILSLLESAEAKTLEEWGQVAEGYAVEECPKDIGTLANSISHKVSQSEHCVEYGTNLEYGIYQEFGTGIYAEEGNGRKTPWAYVDADGQRHWTHGNKPHPFIRPAIYDHTKEYADILYENCTNA